VSDPDFTQPPSIGTLVVHGVGLIGGSLGMAARVRGLAGEVVGVGRDATRLEAGVRLGAIDRYVIADESAALADACAPADLVILCTPVPNIVRDLPGVLAAVGPDAVVTDVGSVKQVIVDAAGGDPRFVGSHPMAGSELAGVYAAKADLFHNATWALTPTSATSPSALAIVRAFAHAVGSTARVLTPLLHDQAVAVTSHLPHALAYALASLADDRSADNPDLAHLAAGSFAGATRVATSSPILWTEIACANQHALTRALHDYRARLEQMQIAIDDGDWETLQKLFEDGHEAKRRWPGR
jgi:prephenate dehydrogenase